MRRLGKIWLALLASCGGCPSGPKEIRELVSKDASYVLEVQSPAALGEATLAYAARLTKDAGGEIVTRMVLGIEKQFGLNPFRAEGYATLGLDPNAPVLVFHEPPDLAQPLLAVRVSDARRFEKALAALVQKVDGADQVTTRKAHGRKITTISRPFGDESVDVLHWARFGDFAVLTRAKGKEHLERLAARFEHPPPAQDAPDGIETTPDDAGLRAKAPPSLVSIYAKPKDASAAQQWLTGEVSTWTAVTLGAAGFSLSTLVELGWKELAALLAAPSGAPLLSWASERSAAVAVSQGVRAETLALLLSQTAKHKGLSQAVAQFQAATGLSLTEQVAPLLDGPAVISIELVNLSQLGSNYRRLLSYAKLLEHVHLGVVLKLRDPAAMLGLLEQSAKELRARGVPIKRTEVKVDAGTGAPLKAVAYRLARPDRPDSKLGWAVLGDRYVYGAGAGHLDALLAFLASDQGGLSPGSSEQLAPWLKERIEAANSHHLVIRSSVVAQAVAALTPKGLVGQLGVGALVQSLAQVVSGLGDIALDVTPDDTRVRIELIQKFK